jgi:hypothetical protein
VSHVTDGHYEVLDPMPDAMPPKRRRPARWLVRNRLVLVLLAILVVVIGREVITRNREVPDASAGPLTAVVRGLDWDPTSTTPRLVEVELTNIGNRSIAATRLQMHGDGMPPGDVREVNRELGQGDRARIKFGVGDPYCVTTANARLDGTVFDIAGAARTVALDVEDPDGMLERVNDLACFGGAQLVTAEIDADAMLAGPPGRGAGQLRIPVTIRNDGPLPVLVTDLIVNEHGVSQIATAVPAHESTDAEAVVASVCQPADQITSLALHGEDFGGRFIQFELSIGDRVRAYLDRVLDRCP